MMSKAGDEHQTTDSSMDESDPIRGLIVSLKMAIVEKSETTKTLIQQLAIELCERKICKIDEISRNIKQTLKDEIREGKITARWIESCLPGTYKRHYCKKSNLGSLHESAPVTDQTGETLVEEVKANGIVRINAGVPEMVSNEEGINDSSGKIDTESESETHTANYPEIVKGGTCMNLYEEGICSEYLCAFMIGKSAFADAGADKSDPQESWYALVSADNFQILKASSLTLDLKHTLRKRYSQVCA